MITPAVLVVAYIVDLAIGDPRWLPHPVRLIGFAICRFERSLRSCFVSPAGQKQAGVLLVFLIVLPAFLLALALCYGIAHASGKTSVFLGTGVLIYLVSSTLAVRGLVDSARLVVESVKGGGLLSARRNLSMIVGRDTEKLTEKDVLRAVTETLSENLSDGVIAPIFYLVLGGLPLAIAYKAINTLDSMVGYKNETYINFGWASARLDDLANYIPARITGILIVMAVFFMAVIKRRDYPLSLALRAYRSMRRDGRKHTSPNSGIPEAAMAGGLGIRMGGPSTYGSVLVEKPYIGDAGNEDYLSASEDAIMVVHAASAVGVGIAALLLSLRGAL